jgi:hypothetical protein
MSLGEATEQNQVEKHSMSGKHKKSLESSKTGSSLGEQTLCSAISQDDEQYCH